MNSPHTNRSRKAAAKVDPRLIALLAEARQLAEAGGFPFYAACYDERGERVLHSTWVPAAHHDECQPHFPREQEMAEVHGQEAAGRGLEVAAAGGHHLLLIGPPGAGKSMLARTLPTLLPTAPVPRPFRAPHSSCDLMEIAGKKGEPGELTLAHGGVLLLENLAAFAPRVLAAVRQAVREGAVAIQQGTLPAVFHLIATMPPCPCGFYGDPVRECTCTTQQIIRYLQRVREVASDCFDLTLRVLRIDADQLARQRTGESSATIQTRVERARALQARRFAGGLQDCNGRMGQEDIERYCRLDAPGQRLLTAAIQQLHLSIKETQRLLRVSRTIADLAGCEQIQANHIAEAVQYRASQHG
jgi:magnesium chelatase family protein